MQALKTLIDRASEMCGGDAALARELNCSRSLVCLMRKGERAVTPEMAIILADMLNENVDLALRQAHIAAAANSKNGYKITQILGKGLAAGGLAMLATSYSGAANAYTALSAEMSTALNNVYIVSFWLRALKRLGRILASENRALAAVAVEPPLPQPL